MKLQGTSSPMWPSLAQLGLDPLQHMVPFVTHKNYWGGLFTKLEQAQQHAWAQLTKIRAQSGLHLHAQSLAAQAMGPLASRGISKVTAMGSKHSWGRHGQKVGQSSQSFFRPQGQQSKKFPSGGTTKCCKNRGEWFMEHLHG